MRKVTQHQAVSRAVARKYWPQWESIIWEIEMKHAEVLMVAYEKFDEFLYKPVKPSYFSFGRSAGYAQYKPLPMRCKYHLALFAHYGKRAIDRTVPHEIAHIIAYYVYAETGHGRHWRRINKVLGGEDSIYHDFVVASLGRTVTQYEWLAEDGTKMWLGPIQHRRALAGKQYIMRGSSAGTIAPTGRRRAV